MNKQQLEGAIMLKIAQSNEGKGIDEDYSLSFVIIEKETSYKVVFTWIDKVTDKGGDENWIRDYEYNKDWFEWLKSERLSKLDSYLDDVLETVNNSKVSYESK